MSSVIPSDFLLEEHDEGSSEAGASSLQLTVQELFTHQWLNQDDSAPEIDESATHAELPIRQDDSDPSDGLANGISHRTYSLTLQLTLLSGLPFESSPATLLDDAQGLLGQKALGRSRCISQTALRHLQDFSLEVSPENLCV